MALPRATLALPFGAVDQATGTRHLLAGELVEAINTRMVKADEYSKRLGFDRTVTSTFVGGTPSGTPKEYTIVAGADVWRDGTDQVWARDPDSNTAYYRGKQARAFPTYFPIKRGSTNNGEPSVRKPVIALAGQDVWIFSQHTSPTNPYDDYSAYTVTVMDATTKVIKYSAVGAAVSSISQINGWSVAYDSANGKVWLMLVGGSADIEAHSYSASSPSTAATVTAYRSVVGKAFNTVDILKLSNGEFFVTASSFVAGTPHTMYFEHSYLETTGGSAGTAKTSPAAVGTTTTAATPAAQCCTGISILNYNGANGTVYYALWRTKATAVTNIQLVLVEVNTTTLAISAGPTELVARGGGQTASPIVGVCSGYRAANGDRVVFAQYDTNQTAKPRDLDLSRFTWNGASSTEAVLGYHAVLLSKPFAQGSDYYFLSGYDDGQTTKLQRTYFLRNQDGLLVSVFLQGDASAAWHQAVGRDSGGGNYKHNTGFINFPVNVTGNVWMVPVAADDSANESAAINVVSLDFSETYAPPVVLGDIAVFTGPIPQVAGPRDNLHDLAPLLFPSATPTFGLGSGGALGTFQVCYRYRFQDSSGRVYRSTPSATASAAFLASGTRSVTCQALSHIAQGQAYIEIYGSVAGGTALYLQQVVDNSTIGANVTPKVFPERWTAGGELLDVTGSGSLSQAPPPPSRAAALWRNRLFLSGTPNNEEIWFSKELQDGKGPELNEILIARWPEGTGPVRVLHPVDFNYLSAHKNEGSTPAIGVLSGPGPDGRGSGNYTVSTLSGGNAARAGSAVVGPAGLYFQSVSDGRVKLLPPGALQAIDVGQGVEDHRTTNVDAALHVEPNREVWFHLTNGKCLVLDYGHPVPPKHPVGRWHVWSGAGLATAAVGAAMSGSTPRFLESNATITLRQPGSLYTDDNGSAQAVLTKMKFCKLAPANQQGEFMVDRIKFLGQHVSSSDLRISVTNGDGTTETFTKAGTASPVDYQVRPSILLRTQEITDLTIEETAGTGAGFVYDSVAIELKLYGRTKIPAVGQWI